MKLVKISVLLLFATSLSGQAMGHRGPRKADARRSNMRLFRVTNNYCQKLGTDSDACSSAHDKVKEYKSQLGQGGDGYIKGVRDYTKELQDLIHSDSSSDASSDSSSSDSVI